VGLFVDVNNNKTVPLPCRQEVPILGAPFVKLEFSVLRRFWFRFSQETFR